MAVENYLCRLFGGGKIGAAHRKTNAVIAAPSCLLLLFAHVHELQLLREVLLISFALCVIQLFTHEIQFLEQVSDVLIQDLVMLAQASYFVPR
jgi:hypothetical protein